MTCFNFNSSLASRLKRLRRFGSRAFDGGSTLIATICPDGCTALYTPAMRPRPIDMRPVDPQDFMQPKVLSSTQNVWMRATTPLGDDVVLNQCVIAYASDMSFLSTSMRPHGMGWQTPGLQSASLDHAIWFHRHSQFNDWHLYAQKSPSGSGGRGFNLGEIYSQDGTLVASTAQEGLIRFRPPSET